MKKYLFINFILVVIFTGIKPVIASTNKFSGITTNINPSVVNSAGLHNITSFNNDLTNSVSEVGISTFSSTNYYLYSGILQTISYPNRITTLSALRGTNVGEIMLQWIVPGADGTIGTCSKYDIRYSTKHEESPAISEEQFQLCESVAKFSPIPEPQQVGTLQNMLITGLTPEVTYYFAIKSRDANYSWSFLSNGSTTTAYTQLKILSVTINPATYYNFGLLELGISTVTPSEIILTNTGNVPQKYLIRCSTVTIGGVPWVPSGNPGFDTFTLKSAFHPVRPSVSSFGPEDIVWSTNTVSTSDIYSIDGSQTGTNVLPNENRKWWLMLKTALDTSTTVQQKIRIYFTAEEQD